MRRAERLLQDLLRPYHPAPVTTPFGLPTTRLVENAAASGSATAIAAYVGTGLDHAVAAPATPRVAFNIDANNRQLHPTEKQRIKELAAGDPEQEARLTAAACALVRCYAEYPEGSLGYSALKAMADAGASEAFASERAQLEAQQGLFAYTTTGFLNDQHADALKKFNNAYQFITRALGGGQAVLGGAGVVAGAASAPASCTTGIGCFANAGVVVLSADAMYAGGKQLVSGVPEDTFLNQALQGLGLSPEAASYAEFALGVGAATKAGAVQNAITEFQGTLNSLGKASYSEFATNGVKVTPEVMDTRQARALMKEVQAANPGILQAELEGIMRSILSSGTTLPVPVTATSGSVLVKVVPKGEAVSSYSPYWMSIQQARSLATMTSEQAGQALGLPATQAAKMLEKGMDFYAITAESGTNPTVFVSDIASTSQGAVRTSPTAQQVIVPNRSLWSDPLLIDPFTLR